MAVSGRQNDAHFAAGLGSVFCEKLRIIIGADGHWRPQANLGLPFGRIEADYGCCLISTSNHKSTLLIVERESSAPGNERNILKWFQAIRSRTPIELNHAGTSQTPRVEQVVLVLAFVRSEKWDRSDFTKTVAFCRLLADVVNEQSCQSTPSFRVLIDEHPTPADCFESCGKCASTRILLELATLGMCQQS